MHGLQSLPAGLSRQAHAVVHGIVDARQASRHASVRAFAAGGRRAAAGVQRREWGERWDSQEPAGRRQRDLPPQRRQRQDSERPEQPTQRDLDLWLSRLAALPPTARGQALRQLLRVEEEGAFVGRLSSTPRQLQGPTSSSRYPSSSRRSRPELEDLESRDWVSSNEEDEASSSGGGGGGQGQLPGDRQAFEELPPQHRRMVTELVNGITRWRRRLDYIIYSLIGRKDPSSLDAPVRQLLRMGLYEMVELGEPPHVINEHVQLAKTVMHAGAASFTNGVLRNAVRALSAGKAGDGPGLPTPPPPPTGAPLPAVADALGLALSHPSWMVERWLERFGQQDTVALLRHNNARPRHSLRLRPGLSPAEVCSKLAAAGVSASPSPYLPEEFVRVAEGGMQQVLASGLVRGGHAQVQDEAAGLVVALLDPQPGERILDACAAPGGKCLFAAARMRGRGSITALDVNAARLQALLRVAHRQGWGGMVHVEAGDLRQFAAAAAAAAAAGAGANFEAAEEDGGTACGSSTGEQQQQGQAPPTSAWQYDRVLLDAPCSGTGVLSKRADLRWRRTPEEVEQLAALQADLLDAAACLVVSGGLLIYSTCSIEEKENEGQAAAFLARHAGRFVLEPPPPSCALPPACLTADGSALAMLPHVHGTDGAFGVRLRRLS